MAENLSEKTFNRGEWSELYVFLKLLGEGRLYAADESLNKIPDTYLEILKVIRHEVRHEVEDMEVEYHTSARGLTVTIVINGMPKMKLNAALFLKHAELLFSHISNPAVEGPTIKAPAEVCNFCQTIEISNPKAKSMPAHKGDFGGKNDIVVQVRDGSTSVVSVVGFSIKSSFASAPTLFNAGKKSALLFHVDGATCADAESFNSFITGKGDRDWKACASFLRDKGYPLNLIGTRGGDFAGNLLIVRDRMMELLAACLIQRFVMDTAITDVPSVIAAVTRDNPLGYPDALKVELYEKAFKDFLFASFTGLTAKKPWDGKEHVNGGYIVVKDNGEVLCYHASDIANFKEYLFRNTYFEYVSSKKFEWSYMETDGMGGYILPLNFSIRFREKLHR